MYFKTYSKDFVNVHFPQELAIYANRPRIRPKHNSQQISKVCIQTDHTSSILGGTQFCYGRKSKRPLTPKTTLEKKNKIRTSSLPDARMYYRVAVR